MILLVMAGALTAQDKLDLGDGVALELVRVPEGEFLLGEAHITRSLTGVFGPHEFFGRMVRLTRGFRIGKYEVTVDQFRRFAEDARYQTDAETGRRPWRGLTTGAFTLLDGAWRGGADVNWRRPGFAQDGRHPVTCVSWFDANAFCEWASKRSGRKCRLPAEAELEYAQRARSRTRYYWGISMDPKWRWANVADDGGMEDEDVFFERREVMKNPVAKGRNDGYKFTSPVGMFSPNAFGLYDAAGNVWEYTLDWFGITPAAVDPRGSGAEKIRGMRGGGWMSTPDLYRSSFRAEIEPESRTATRGFRLLVEE